MAQAAAHAAGLAAAREQEAIRAERDRLAETVALLRARVGDGHKAGAAAAAAATNGGGAAADAPTSNGEYSDAREASVGAEEANAPGAAGAGGTELSAAAQVELLRAQLAVEREERRRQAEAEALARSELARAMEELHALRARLGPAPGVAAVAGAPAAMPAAALAPAPAADAGTAAPVDAATMEGDGPVKMDE